MTENTSLLTRSKQRKSDEEKTPRNRTQAPLKKRVRPMMLAAAVALIIACALGAATLLRAAGNTESALVTNTDITRGQEFTESSFKTIEVGAGQAGLRIFTDTQIRELIGKIASVDLPAGSLITPNAVTDSILPAAGASIVTISLKPDQTPARPFISGDPIRLVDTGAATQGATNAVRGTDVPGTIATVKTDSVSGNTIIDISVKEPQSSEVAARIARGSIAVVVDSNKGNQS
ncbi:MAG: SAF domain-containing protein [Renibacterium salmoninarum]|nr:SAF domain-containing protein [Renibacterium salmoninarum]